MRLPAPGQKEDRAEVLLRAAIKKEVVDGDLKAAIAQYEKIVAAYGRNRAAVAKALVQIGQCQEKLGNAEARKACERVVREYGDQAEAVSFARERLASIPRKGEPPAAKPRLRLAMAAFPLVGFGLAPDGEHVAYSERKEGKWGIWISDFAGFETRWVTTGRGPAWSPDGKHLAFMRMDEASKANLLWIISLSDGAERQLTKVHSQSPVWSPDGNHLAFFGARDPDEEGGTLYMVRAAGGEPRLVTKAWPTHGAQWSPDSTRITYTHADEHGNRDA